MSTYPSVNYNAVADVKWKTFVPAGKETATTEKPQKYDIKTDVDPSVFYRQLQNEPCQAKPQKRKIQVKPKPTKTNRKKIVTSRDISEFLKYGELNDSAGLVSSLESGVCVDVVDQYGWTALMCAACAGAIKAVETLLNAAADRSLCNSQGRTAAQLAEINKHSLIVDMLHASPAVAPPEAHCDVGSRSGAGGWCSACGVTVTDLAAHSSSTVHLISTTTSNTQPPAYLISPRNLGYQMMLRSGWDKQRALGSEGQGIKYPVKTVLKQDRTGIGFNQKVRPRVTHFSAYDTAAVTAPRKERAATRNKQELLSIQRRNKRKEAKYRRDLL